jgi:drug/metabolite transporter (DMT)-like permease
MVLDKKGGQWGLLIILAFIWGTSFILMKKGLESYTNIQVAAFRIFFSFIIFLPIIIKRLKKINRNNIKSLLLVGFLGNMIPAFLFTKAQTQIDSSLAGILNSVTPLFTLVIGILFYKSRVKLINITGLVLGFIGAMGLIYNGTAEFLKGNSWYTLFVVIATACYGITVNEIKYKLENLDGVTIACLSFFFTGPVAGILLLFSDFSATVHTENYLRNLGFISILALFNSVIAVTLFNILIKYTSAIFAASVTYIIPIFAIFWGIFDGERISLDEILWSFVILLGVYLVNKEKLISI